jgi:hypothetical protein
MDERLNNDHETDQKVILNFAKIFTEQIFGQLGTFCFSQTPQSQNHRSILHV